MQREEAVPPPHIHTRTPQYTVQYTYTQTAVHPAVAAAELSRRLLLVTEQTTWLPDTTFLTDSSNIAEESLEVPALKKSTRAAAFSED